MTPHEAKAYLDSFINYETQMHLAVSARFDLRRVERLLAKLGDFHKGLSCIHVAGTNGKGSVCAFTASILQHAGFLVGLYTSPHLVEYHERIRILENQDQHIGTADNSGQITEQEICCILDEISPTIETVRRQQEWGELTFFEVFTVMALYYCHQKQVDWVVLETGLGGRLDATNIVEAKVAVLTPIGLDHTQLLGETLEAIVLEKAGIIKNQNQNVVVAPQEPSVMKIIEERCRSLGIKPLKVGEDISYQWMAFADGKMYFSVQGKKNRYPKLTTSLIGEHQIINAAAAIGIMETLTEAGVHISPEVVRDAIAAVRWPGRFEIVQKNPYLVLDGAHNPSAAQALNQTIKKIFPEKRIILVVGFSKDKDRRGICRPLGEVADEIIFTRAEHPRAFVPEERECQELFPQKKIHILASVEEAMDKACGLAGVNDVILVTGSLFVVAEARRICTNSKV